MDDVSDVVRSAAADGKRVAAQRTGHLANPLGSLADTVLLRTAGLAGVQLDVDAGNARVGAGALWQDLVLRASDADFAALHGSSPNVCIAGYTLGGGVRFGLPTADPVSSGWFAGCSGGASEPAGGSSF